MLSRLCRNQFKAKCLMEVEQTNSLSDNIAAQVREQGVLQCMYSPNTGIINRTLSSVPNATFVYLTTSELKDTSIFTIV